MHIAIFAVTFLILVPFAVIIIGLTCTPWPFKSWEELKMIEKKYAKK